MYVLVWKHNNKDSTEEIKCFSLSPVIYYTVLERLMGSMTPPAFLLASNYHHSCKVHIKASNQLELNNNSHLSFQISEIGR